jgi:serine/threonine protein kinase/tetratricopeptide (TPR) repeat protein
VTSEPIVPPDWEELEGLVDAVLDAPPEQRKALIAELAGGNAARAATLRAMVEDCERGLPLLDRPATEQFRHLSDDPDSLLPAMVGQRYRTGRELGRGGMARVYLAHDVKHGRDVAIKVLRPELSQSLGHERFLREIEIAARLRHPNIVPLYDSGEIDGALYFVMPYEEGPSLRERLRSGPLPLPDVLGVLRDVARALAYAHEHGVVHRDVKSDNVMLSGDAAVVADFGIAKAVSAALTDAGGTELTQAGSAIGTPAYMAPEQAAGDPAMDHRADLYSFGCLAYEVLTGQPPFHGLSKHQVIAAHLMTVPPPVTTASAAVPPALAALVARCLEKDPAARPQTAREVVRALDLVPAESGTWPMPAAAPRRPRKVIVAVVAALIGLLALGGYFVTDGTRGDTRPISLAVLPFKNMDVDSTMDVVADGLADAVAGALTRVPGIEIRSRSGARIYRARLSVDMKEAGAKLNAAYVMHGLIRQERGRWIVSVDLARAADATSIWSDNFDFSRDEVAGATDAITGRVVEALRTRFPAAIGEPPALAPNQRTTNEDAWRLWVRGEERLKRRGQSVRESAELFREAIRHDSLYARAHAGLSLALAFFPYFQGVPASEIRDEVIAAATRALELDSTLAAPHTALGLVYQFDLQWDRAEREHETAIRLEPQYVEARIQHARHQMMRQRPAEALRQLRIARIQDPASAVVLSLSASPYRALGQMDSAKAEARRAYETDSTNMTTLGIGALIMIETGQLDSARMLVRQLRPGTPLHAYSLARTDPAEARRFLRDLDGRVPQPWLAETNRTFVYLGLGDTASALSALERATDGGEIWTSLFNVEDRAFDAIRGSDRFRALVRRVGLTDNTATRGRAGLR